MRDIRKITLDHFFVDFAFLEKYIKDEVDCFWHVHMCTCAHVHMCTIFNVFFAGRLINEID